jgi:fibro-slime domain-containing protein
MGVIAQPTIMVLARSPPPTREPHSLPSQPRMRGHAIPSAGQNLDRFWIDFRASDQKSSNSQELSPLLRHIHHFTTEIHTVFTYMGGESFTFTGDDDVWVFINKKLVIDIGGVHGNSPGSVNLDNLGLTMGINYPLDVFHAERHTTQSNFRIDTTICSQPQ